MKPNYIKLCLLLLIFLIIVPLYVFVQGYVARYDATFLIAFKNISIISAREREAVTIIGLEFIGSLVVACVTLLPAGYMFPKRWVLVSAVLAIITLSFLVFTYPADTTTNWFLAVIRAGEYVGVLMAYFSMALAGSRLSRLIIKSYNHGVHPIAEKAGSG